MNLTKILRNFIVINVNKVDCIGSSNDVTYVPASYRRRRSRYDIGKEENGSGIMLLFLGVMGIELPKRESMWTNGYTRKLQYFNNNILASSKSNHFDYEGQYYSFGNKCIFRMIGKSSVDIYGSKSYQNNDSNSNEIMYTKEMELASADEVNIVVTHLGEVTPNVHRLISTVVDVAYNIQATYGSVNLQRVETASSGIW